MEWELKAKLKSNISEPYDLFNFIKPVWIPRYSRCPVKKGLIKAYNKSETSFERNVLSIINAMIASKRSTIVITYKEFLRICNSDPNWQINRTPHPRQYTYFVKALENHPLLKVIGAYRKEGTVTVIQAIDPTLIESIGMNSDDAERLRNECLAYGKKDKKEDLKEKSHKKVENSNQQPKIDSITLGTPASRVPMITTLSEEKKKTKVAQEISSEIEDEYSSEEFPLQEYIEPSWNPIENTKIASSPPPEPPPLDIPLIQPIVLPEKLADQGDRKTVHGEPLYTLEDCFDESDYIMDNFYKTKENRKNLV
jgi:hypothetical protein